MLSPHQWHVLPDETQLLPASWYASAPISIDLSLANPSKASGFLFLSHSLVARQGTCHGWAVFCMWLSSPPRSAWAACVGKQAGCCPACPLHIPALGQEVTRTTELHCQKAFAE